MEILDGCSVTDQFQSSNNANVDMDTLHEETEHMNDMDTFYEELIKHLVRFSFYKSMSIL